MIVYFFSINFSIFCSFYRFNLRQIMQDIVFFFCSLVPLVSISFKFLFSRIKLLEQHISVSLYIFSSRRASTGANLAATARTLNRLPLLHRGSVEERRVELHRMRLVLSVGVWQPALRTGDLISLFSRSRTHVNKQEFTRIASIR